MKEENTTTEPDLSVDKVKEILRNLAAAMTKGRPYHQGIGSTPDWKSPLYCLMDITTLDELQKMTDVILSEAKGAVGEIQTLAFHAEPISRSNAFGALCWFTADGVHPAAPSVERTIGCCKLFRREIKEIGAKVKGLKASNFSNEPGTDRGEIIANLTLAYRHLEDAALRLGKAIQELDGGTSIYDK